MDIIKKLEEASKILTQIEQNKNNIIYDELQRIYQAHNGNAITTQDYISFCFAVRSQAITWILRELKDV